MGERARADVDRGVIAASLDDALRRYALAFGVALFLACVLPWAISVSSAPLLAGTGNVFSWNLLLSDSTGAGAFVTALYFTTVVALVTGLRGGIHPFARALALALFGFGGLLCMFVPSDPPAGIEQLRQGLGVAGALGRAGLLLALFGLGWWSIAWGTMWGRVAAAAGVAVLGVAYFIPVETGPGASVMPISAVVSGLGDARPVEVPILFLTLVPLLSAAVVAASLVLSRIPSKEGLARRLVSASHAALLFYLPALFAAVAFALLLTKKGWRLAPAPIFAGAALAAFLVFFVRGGLRIIVQFSDPRGAPVPDSGSGREATGARVRPEPAPPIAWKMLLADPVEAPAKDATAPAPPVVPPAPRADAAGRQFCESCGEPLVFIPQITGHWCARCGQMR